MTYIRTVLHSAYKIPANFSDCPAAGNDLPQAIPGSALAIASRKATETRSVLQSLW